MTWPGFRNTTCSASTAITGPPIASICRTPLSTARWHRAISRQHCRSSRRQPWGLLKADYPSQEEGVRKIVEGLRNYYRASHPRSSSQRVRGYRTRGANRIFYLCRNVFPDLRVTWGIYPNNLGHTDFPGCFRCHDEAHATKDGKTITQDCAACHNMLAVDETAPDILKTLNLAGKVGTASTALIVRTHDERT